MHDQAPGRPRPPLRPYACAHTLSPPRKPPAFASLPIVAPSAAAHFVLRVSCRDPPPATGSAIIRTESAPAMQRAASRENEFGEESALISSLYSGYAQSRRSGTTCVTAIYAQSETHIRACP